MQPVVFDTIGRRIEDEVSGRKRTIGANKTIVYANRTTFEDADDRVEAQGRILFFCWY